MLRNKLNDVYLKRNKKIQLKKCSLLWSLGSRKICHNVRALRVSEKLSRSSMREIDISGPQASDLRIIHNNWKA